MERQTLSFSVWRDTTLTIFAVKNHDLNRVEIVSQRENIGGEPHADEFGYPGCRTDQTDAFAVWRGRPDTDPYLFARVSNGNEGNMGFYVRGGSSDQNLILMDGVPLYNASHILGLFSLFNPETMKNVSLIKGGFPARYGSRLASVTEIGMKQGNLNNYSLEGGVGLLTAKATVQGPIHKGTTSFLVAGRSAYINLLAKPILGILNKNKGSNSIEETITPGFSFFDINLNLLHIFNEKTRIWTTNYWGRDRIDSRVENPATTKRATTFSTWIGKRASPRCTWNTNSAKPWC